ncbi:MAG: hypothetical protein SF029_00480 [bacterium]|nr:hypothetical protein [bacterium]
MLFQAFVTWLHTTFIAWNAATPEREPRQQETGQGLVEYALIIVFIGVVVMALLLVLGPSISNMYSNILDAVQRSSGQ